MTEHSDMLALADLRAANVTRQKEWDSLGQLTLAYRGNELAGEVGEACNVIKKLEREKLGINGSRDTVEHLAEELADVIICTDLIAMQAGINLDAAVIAKFNTTSEKVGLATRLSATTETVEAKWRPIETAPKEDPERPGRDFEIIVGGGEIKDESADLLPWRPFDSWSLACYDSMRGCWRGEQTEQYDCFYLHKPTHWMPKFAGPGQCEPTTSDAVGEPVAASPYEGKMIVDAKLLHALWCYGNLHVVEGVIYSPGSHQECLAQVNALFRERATHPPASPDTSAAILAERERCAAIADEWANKMALNYGRETANTIAAAIRQLPTTERGE